ncbi:MULTISPECIES: hypothetical protein [Aerosakkonema]|uniref:hypothetical protein n=1 Tax=Aerosakkonema TaxID=1246629 RepID=UPI0035BC2DEA
MLKRNYVPQIDRFSIQMLKYQDRDIEPFSPKNFYEITPFGRCASKTGESSRKVA